MARAKKPVKLPKSKKLGTCGGPTGETITQSLIFSKTKHARGKPKWTKETAKAWAKSHKFRYGKVDEKPNTYRLQQFEPGPCEYRTVPFGQSGIQAVMETSTYKRPKPGSNAKLQVLREIERHLAERELPRKK